MVRFFPLWAIALSAVALLFPDPFVSAKAAIPPLLGLIMFGMGMTLSTPNFIEVLQRPQLVALGLALQFTIMPLAAWTISSLLQLPAELLIGMVLVGACSGGTASNVICYLAKGDVALSITLTTCSTLLGIVLTPFLTLVYAGYTIDVSATAMLLTIVKIILIPVILGLLTNHFFGRFTTKFKSIFPAVSVAAIVVIIAIIVALNKNNLNEVGLVLSTAVIMHNAFGLFLGYAAARLFKQNKTVARTIAIEVGMQNSGLAVALAIKHFSGLAALPGALFSIWHNVSGSVLAAWWSKDREIDEATNKTYKS